jgi:hypothetical protein
MKIWFINNTKFGYKNNCKKTSEMMFDYFYNFFIPFIKKNKGIDDILIHSGNIFSSIENINVTILIKVVELFKTISEILPIYIVDGYNERNDITKLFDYTIIKNNQTINNIKILKKDILNNIDKSDNIILINSTINLDLLKDYCEQLFFIGLYDEHSKNDNIITIGSPYQLEKTDTNRGFYVIDPFSRKYKFIKNTHSPQYKTITITDISQIEDLNQDDIKYNNVDIVIDKNLVLDKKIKIDVLLNKFHFKSVSYINDNVDLIEVESNSLKVEDIIKTKIIELDDPEVNAEFENIMNIYKEKYKQ